MLVKWQPFGSILNRDSFFEDFFNTNLPTRRASFEPNIEVRETEKSYEINAELPGLSKDDFKLAVENDHLTLEGEKKYEREQKDEGYYRSERSYGAFKRVFRLTDSVDKKNIKADFKGGVLTITVPKSKEAKPKTIEVNVQ